MASVVARPSVIRSLGGFLRHCKNTTTAVSRRAITYTETGAVLEKPVHVRFGLIKVACTVLPFLMTGAFISREVAALLEEHELFVPDDDDDD